MPRNACRDSGRQSAVVVNPKSRESGRLAPPVIKSVAHARKVLGEEMPEVCGMRSGKKKGTKVLMRLAKRLFKSRNPETVPVMAT